MQIKLLFVFISSIFVFLQVVFSTDDLENLLNLINNQVVAWQSGNTETNSYNLMSEDLPPITWNNITISSGNVSTSQNTINIHPAYCVQCPRLY